MQKLIGGLLLVGVVGGIIVTSLKSEPLQYTAETKTVVETVEVDATEAAMAAWEAAKIARIKAAQDAQMESIASEADTMRQSFIDNAMLEIEAEVLKDIEAEMKARRVDVEKKTGAY